jgi:hypothetical protein
MVRWGLKNAETKVGISFDYEKREYELGMRV